MDQHSFTLSTIGMTKGRAQVKLDGEDISDAVNGVGFDFSAQGHPRVYLELNIHETQVEMDSAEIQLPQRTAEMLQQLGWLAPDEAARLRQVANPIVEVDAWLKARDEVRIPRDVARLRGLLRDRPLRDVPNFDDAGPSASPDHPKINPETP